MLTITATLGVDLGGTKIESALVGETGNILSSHRCPTDPSKNPDKVIEDIVLSVKTCLKQAKRSASALGVGCAGQISRSGVVRFSPNLEGWHDVPLRSRLEQALDLPVVLTNDVRAATWGEWRHGAGKGMDDLVCVFVGTGVGGGVISGGKVLEGCGNTAGEIGHTTILVDGRQCHCPNRGCLEAYAGGWAIAERAQEAVHKDPKSGNALISLAGGLEKISARTISEAYARGDSLAQRLVADTAQYLAAGIVIIVNIFNPCLIIMGGGVILGMPEYITMIEPIVRSKCLQASEENLRIVVSALGNKAGVIGAAALARDFVSKKENK